jgi:hypothetical protein
MRLYPTPLTHVNLVLRAAAAEEHNNTMHSNWLKNRAKEISLTRFRFIHSFMAKIDAEKRVDVLMCLLVLKRLEGTCQPVGTFRLSSSVVMVFVNRRPLFTGNTQLLDRTQL